MVVESNTLYSIKARSSIRQPKEITIKKHYDYVVAIDFGTYSSSFSYARTKGEDDIMTVETWSKTNKEDFGGRVLTSSIYQRNSDGPFLWGGSASKKYYNRSKHYCYIPNIKLYLTEPESQPTLPKGLDPIKITSDYLKEFHDYGLKHMKNHFEVKQEMDTVTQTNAQLTKEDVSDSEEFHSGTHSKKIGHSTILPSQIRYIISYPDNEGDGYQNNLKKALMMAEIINKDDPEERLVFIKESAAVAHYCIQQSLPELKPSRKPYLICDVGSKVFGISSVMIDELVDTGKITSHSQQAINKWGTLELDRRMKKYLKKRFQGSPDFTADQINATIERIFEYYLDDIKFTFENEVRDEDSDISIDMTKIISGDYTGFSDPISDGLFIIPYKDLKEEVFNPVIEGIISSIKLAKGTLDDELDGIFLSGRIGQDDNLQKILRATFGTADIKVTSILSAFSVSEGAIAFALRKRGLQIPYLIGDSLEKTQRTFKQGNELTGGGQLYNEDSIIDSGDSDYVIGLDFGTTFSGFAFASVSENKENKSQFQIIKEVNSWPKQKGNNLSKAPSLLLYNGKLKYKGKFGEEARQIYNRVSGSDVLLRNFKLLLSRHFDPNADDRKLKQLEDFQLVDAIANYLRDFHKEGFSAMSKMLNRGIERSRIRYVITVPAMWSDEAKNTMREAVTRAELVKKEDVKKRVKLITEPEAAALYCEEVFGDQFKMDIEQRFMICDAGGGTVDLVTFKVGQDRDSNNQLVISELTSGIGENCGSSYLDEAFENYVIDKFNEAGIIIVQKAIDEIVEKFSKEIKPNFESSNNPESEYIEDISLPASLNIPSEIEGAGIIDGGYLSLSYHVIETYVFKPVISKILALIEKQLQKLSENDRQLDALLLVGGFGQSTYLYDKVVEKFENQKVGAKFIGQPPNGDMAVSKGAVSFGLKPRMVSESVTRYTYGLQVSKKQDGTLHDPSLRFTGSDGEVYYRNMFSMIIEKASKMNKGDLFVKRVFVEYPNDTVFALYSTEDDTVPKSVIGMEPIYKVTLRMPDLPEFEDKVEGEKIEFDVCVAIYGTDIELIIKHNGAVLDKGVITEKSIVTLKYATVEARKKKKKPFSPKIFLKKN